MGISAGKEKIKQGRCLSDTETLEGHTAKRYLGVRSAAVQGRRIEAGDSRCKVPGVQLVCLRHSTRASVARAG